MELDDDKLPLNRVRAIILGVFASPMLLCCCCLNQYVIAMLVASAAYCVTGHRPYWFYVISKTYKRDLTMAKRMLVAIFYLWKYDRANMTLPKQYNKLVEKHPDKIVFHTEKRSWSFKQLAELSNRGAHMLKRQGLQRKEAIGLMLSNGGGAELPALWMSAATLGAPAALLPPQLKGSALLHVIVAAKITTLLYSDDLADTIKEIIDSPELKGLKLLQYNLVSEDTPLLKNSACVATLLKQMPTTILADEVAKGKYSDNLIYIYTSGTTGLPKAAVIGNTRYFMVATALKIVGDLSDDDILYTPLPLHHTAGAMLGVGQALVFGLTVTLRGKFSASNFWKDCIKYKCTVAQYIGEICRFLLLTAEKNGDGNPLGGHRVRMMVGNGLRYSIWERFQKTFGISQIYELYGATEGNTNMLNITSKVGAVGFVPRLLGFLSPIGLVKCDNITGEPIKDDKGFCIPCKPCEPGLMLGKLNHNKRLYNFTGYVDKEATKKKMMNNVFKTGDLYFNSGDVLVMDHFGFYYFKDRTGDTFRWRGENVSTAEVESILSNIIELTDTTVFGVEIPNVEGKAGMAAIVDPNNKLDLVKMKQKMNSELPVYAHPLFIRIIPQLEVTVTFKIIKRHLQADGFDINKFKDTVYFMDPKTQSYVKLTKDLHDDIISGKIRL